ncbi:hypothetical protein M1437_03155 [Patescibacteria group bacterium]|nr:hypothetical protein [Patescibacteria group bacterium]
MTNRVEAVKNYLVSAADRAVGFSGIKEVLGQATKRGQEKFNQSSVIEMIGVIMIGVSFPAATRAVISLEKRLPKDPMQRQLYMMAPMLPPLLLDAFINTSLIGAAIPSSEFIGPNNPIGLLIHNPMEATAFRLAANAVTHSGIDFASAVANRIRPTKPNNSIVAT